LIKLKLFAPGVGLETNMCEGKSIQEVVRMLGESRAYGSDLTIPQKKKANLATIFTVPTIKSLV